jgi:hypothetical protein
MKTLISILFLLTISINSYALGGYESLGDSVKTVTKTITKELGIVDADNMIKKKIYDEISYAFEGNWNAFWIGLNESSSSKLDDSNDKGVIEYIFNNEDQGTLLITFVYKPEVNQIIITERQIRYGNKKTLLEVFEERKNDESSYKIIHEKSNYAQLQKKGKVSYEFYHVGVEASSLVYLSQSIIDI